MNNQFNRSFEVPLKQFWCRSFQDSNSCGIHLKVFALFFSSAAAAPSSSEGQKKGDSLMFIIIGCLVAVTMVVAFIGGLCYIGRTHQQIYSKLPSEFPDWLTELMKLHVLAVLVVVISVARISRSPPNCVSWMNDWLNENSYIVCSCSVGCGYISHTHQQICFKLPSEFPEWMTIYTWGIEHYTQNLACSCGVGCVYLSHTNQQISSILSSEFPEWMKIYIWGIEHYTQNLACSCGVGCGYFGRTHQQISSILPSEFPEWMKIYIWA